MKFVKSEFAKKLIIVLIALMIFNIAVPRQAYALDIGGILLKPLTSLILVIVASVDVMVGSFLVAMPATIKAIGEAANALSRRPR